MKDSKEKTQPEKELDKLKNKPMTKELLALIDKKQAYINRDVKK